MIALIPLFFHNNIESQFWKKGDGHEYFLWVLREINRLNQIESILVLALESGWEYLQSHNITVLQVCNSLFQSKNSQSIEEFSFFGKQLLEIISPHLPSQDSEVLCVDIRNPSLNLSLLEKALRCSQESDLPMLVSIQEVTDHPCQCWTYSQVIDVGMIHFFDFAIQNSKKLGTKFFPVYPANLGHINKLSKQTEKDNPTQAKVDLMVSEDAYDCFGDESPAGIFHRDIPEAGQALDISILKSVCIDSDGLLHIRFPKTNGQIATHVTVQPFKLPDFTFVTSRHVSLSSNQVDHIEIALDLDITDLSGLIYTISQNVFGGPYDIANNHKPIQSLWTYDENGIAINSSNGRKILGRQDFPPVFEVENSIIVTKAAKLPDMQTILDNGGALGFPVKQSKMTINTKNDVLLAKAIIHTVFKSHNQFSQGELYCG
nr:hypothetical protein [uncultured Desulfobacter sp.]